MTRHRTPRARRPLAAALTLAVGGLLLASAPPASAAEIPLDLNEYASRTVRLDGTTDHRIGRALTGGCDLTGDGVADVVVGVPELGSAPAAGRVYVVPGGTRAAGTSHSLDPSGPAPAGSIVIDGDPALSTGQAGITVECAGDVDDDGREDLVIGASSADRAYVVFGGASLVAASPLDLGDLGEHGFEIATEASYDLGSAVAGVGDLDGDGMAEVAVHSLYGEDQGSTPDWAGTTYVVRGRAATTAVDARDATEMVMRIFGPDAPSQDGEEMSLAGVGDVNRDDVPDLLVGVPMHDSPNGPETGAAFVVSGTARGDVSLADWQTDPDILFPIWGADPARRGSQAGRTGKRVAPAGDVNGDGHADLMIDAFLWSPSPIATVRGRVTVVYGKAGGAPVNLDDPGSAAYEIVGTAQQGSDFDSFGSSFSSLGDVDGDGNDDLAIGVPDVDGPRGTSVGAAYVVYGRGGGQDVTVENLACEDGAVLRGREQNDQVGYTVAGSAGFTGAGVPTLLSAGANRLLAVPLADVPGSCSDEPVPPEEVFYEIDWGFRENFRNYIHNGWRASQPAAPITAEAGARCDPNPDTERGGCDPRVDQSSVTPLRALRWTAVGAGATDGSDTTIAGRGRVIFRYPAHFFTFTLEDPWITIAGGQATLRARVELDVTDPDSAFGIGSADVRVPMATFPLAGPPRRTDDYVRWRFEAGVLTQEAADSLGTFLGAGAELDPLTITIPRTLGGLPEEPGVPRRDEPRTDPPRTGPPTVDPPRGDPPRGNPPRVAPPRARAARIDAAPARALRVGANGRVTLTRVRCRTGTCTVRTPGSVRFRIGRRRFAARVVAPRRLRAGQSGTVRLVLARRAVRALEGRRATVRVRIEVRSGDSRVVRTIGVKLRRPRG